MADGSVIFDTGLDLSGFQRDAAQLAVMATQIGSTLADSMQINPTLDVDGAETSIDGLTSSLRESAAAEALLGEQTRRTTEESQRQREETRRNREETERNREEIDTYTRIMRTLSEQLGIAANASRNANAEMRQINDALRLDPTNVELLGQRFQTLGNQINSTEMQLTQLRTVEQQMQQGFESGEIGEEQYRGFRREIINAESRLKSLTAQRDNVDRLGDEFQEAAVQVNHFGDEANTASKRIGNLKAIGASALTAVATAAAAVGTALVASGTYAVKLASDLAESQNVIDTTFGDNASAINGFAKNAGIAFGMSELEAKKFNGTMGAMLKSMQLSDAEVLNMSTSMVGLAGDIASFYNLDSQEAFDKIRSGISGETEPLILAA